jgi:hypothetical protein
MADCGIYAVLACGDQHNILRKTLKGDGVSNEKRGKVVQISPPGVT